MFIVVHVFQHRLLKHAVRYKSFECNNDACLYEHVSKIKKCHGVRQ